MLAGFYKVEHTKIGNSLMIRKTPDSEMADRNRVREYITQQMVVSHGGEVKRMKYNSIPKISPGAVVAEGVLPLNSDNKGHQLLTKMGWSGGGLGSNDGTGIVEPLTVVITKGHHGIGF